MQSVINNREFRKYKIALSRWESEGGAPAPYVSRAPERAKGRRDTGSPATATAGTCSDEQ